MINNCLTGFFAKGHEEAEGSLKKHKTLDNSIRDIYEPGQDVTVMQNANLGFTAELAVASHCG